MASENRRHPRYAVNMPGRLTGQGYDIACSIRDISAGGTGLQVDPLYVEFPSHGELVSEQLGTLKYRTVHRSFNRVGIEFDLAFEVEERLAANLALAFSRDLPSS